MKIKEKPGAETPWSAINQLLEVNERFEVENKHWNGFLLAPKHPPQLAAILYHLHDEGLPFCVQGKGSERVPSESEVLIVSSRAFSQLLLYEEKIVEVGAGCSIYDLKQFLFPYQLEVSLEPDPMGTFKRSVGGSILFGRTAGILYHGEKFCESITGLEMVAFDGSRIVWGGPYGSPLSGPFLSNLIWNFHEFPGIIVKFYIKTYPIPQARFRLSWSFSEKESCNEQLSSLQQFTSSWENLEVLRSGVLTDQSFIFAQISGSFEEMEEFRLHCPNDKFAKKESERLNLQEFLNQKQLNVYQVDQTDELNPGEYLWEEILEERYWLLTSRRIERIHQTNPKWKDRLIKSLYGITKEK